MQLDVDEAKRIAELYMYGILDSRFEERFDRLTRIASAIFKTPIALVSLVDTQRQWFKSSYGLDARQTSRDIAFCSHAIRAPEVFVVPDATKDARFAQNPLVTAGPHIRFYAGAPLITPGRHALGTLCVIDYQPRPEFTPSDQSTLKDLADTVMDFFELQRAMRIAKAEVRKGARRAQPAAGPRRSQPG